MILSDNRPRMEKLVGKVTYVRIPKLGLFKTLKYKCIVWCVQIVFAKYLQNILTVLYWLYVSGINISLGASLVTELDDPGK